MFSLPNHEPLLKILTMIKDKFVEGKKKRKEKRNPNAVDIKGVAEMLSGAGKRKAYINRGPLDKNETSNSCNTIRSATYLLSKKACLMVTFLRLVIFNIIKPHN